MRIEFTAQVRVGDGKPICTDNVVTLDDDGTLLLHMQLMGIISPILDLAVPPNAPVGILTAIVSALMSAAATIPTPESNPAP